MTKTIETHAAAVAYKAIADKLGEDIVVLDIKEISSLADYFVIAQGKNTIHVRAMAEHVDEQLAKVDVKTRHVEGYAASRWILMDFGFMVVHLFCKEEREYYRLERLWADARHVLQDELELD